MLPGNKAIKPVTVKEIYPSTGTELQNIQNGNQYLPGPSAFGSKRSVHKQSETTSTPLPPASMRIVVRMA